MYHIVHFFIILAFTALRALVAHVLHAEALYRTMWSP